MLSVPADAACAAGQGAADTAGPTAELPFAPPVNDLLAFNASTNLIVGFALMLAWQRDRSQRFTRSMGQAHLALGLQILVYSFFAETRGLVYAGAAVVTAVLLTTYLHQLFTGAAQLLLRPRTN